MRETIRIRPLAILLIVGFLIVAIVKVAIYPDPFLASARSLLSSFTLDRPDPPAAVLMYAPAVDPFGESSPDWESTQRNFQTMVQLITSKRTISQAVLDSKVASFPRIKNADNPEQLLHDHIEIRRPDENTLLIEISAPGLPRAESATVINALVSAFLNLQDELANVRTMNTIDELERIDAKLRTQLQEHFERLAELDRSNLEPDGPALSPAEIEAEFRSCLEHLRRVQLDRAALPPNAEEDALAPLDRQMAMLVAERDRLAAAIARSKASDPERLLQQQSIDNILETRNQIQKSLVRAKFRSDSAVHSNSAFRSISADSQWFVISRAE